MTTRHLEMEEKPTFDLIYDAQRHLILGKIHGEFDSSVVSSMAAALAVMAREHACSKVLNDLRDAIITRSAFDIFDMPRIVEKAGVPYITKRALVVREPLEDFQFLETVSFNVGQRVRVFTNYDTAIKWLTGPSA